MKIDVVQSSFAGGEFGPSLFGRTDISQYQNACETIENLLVRPYGSAISAPGSVYVATVSDSTLRTRLLKFVFNRSDAYVIEAGDEYMRFYTNRGQVVDPGGTEDLSAFTANLKAHWKMNDNVSGTGTTVVLDAVGSHNGTASTITSSLSTTGIVSLAFDLDARYHVSVADNDVFTRTASSQPMTILGWFYYSDNGAAQALCSKSGEYELSINSSSELAFSVSSGNPDTKLLLHCNGTDASTTFTDSSDSAHTVTANGNAQIDTAQSVFGGASGLFDGTGDYLSIPDSADWDFGTGDFTIDLRVRFNSTTGRQDIFSRSDINIIKGATGNLQLLFEGALVYNETWGPSTNTWYHIAITRSGTNLRAFVNGTQLGATVTDSTDITGTTGIFIGINEDAASNAFNGWIDELRVIKGSAAWTIDFTIPSSEYAGSASNSWTVDDNITEGWHFIGLVFKGDGTTSTDCKIYIDGVLEDSTFSSSVSFVRMSNTSSLFRIGTTSSAGAKNWADKLDNFAFIHQELTAAQVASLYTTSAYQIDTVFEENEVAAIHYTQLNDVIYLTHPDHPPQQLTRVTANDWTIANFDFVGGPFLDENTNTAITITASATTGTVNLTVSPTNANLFTRSTSTLGHHGSYWMIGGLAQTNTTTGLQEVGYVEITNVVNSYTATATVIKNLKVSSATSIWAEGAWSAVRGYPSKVIFHDSRLWFGRTNYEPQKIWGSKIFEFDKYNLDTQDDDDALNLQLASNESNEVQWLSSTRNLLAGTYGGGFVVSSGGDDVAITPDNANSNEEIGIGSSSIAPKRIGQFLYFLQRFQKVVRELFFSWDLDTYKAVDRTILSPHILGDSAIDMDVQLNPSPILYCVRTEGTLAMLTREPDQEFAAWSRRTTSGTYTSIAIIPSQSSDYDEAWVIVERWVNGSQKKYVEYFENPVPPARQDLCIYLDSALTFNAYNATSTSSCTISLSASSGSITLTSSTGYFNGGMIGKRIRAIDANGTTIGEGSITATASTTSITLSITTTFNALSYAAGRWGVSVASVSGLTHLEAKTVGILADGATESLTRTVVSGLVSLGSNYWVVHVGLSYNQIIKTLPREAGAQRGTAQGKLQRISEVAFKLNRSYMGFQYGLDADNLDTLTSVDSTLTQSLSTGTFGNFPFRGGYQRGTPIYIKNANPLPIEVLSIIAAIDTQEK